MSSPDEFDFELRSALELDRSERAYLSGLNLAGAWRSQPANASSAWGWLALLGVVSAFVAWTLALQPLAVALAAANLVGLSTLALSTMVGLLLELGRALIDLSLSPVLGLSRPLLAVLALVLLFWQRLKAAPFRMQGARS